MLAITLVATSAALLRAPQCLVHHVMMSRPHAMMSAAEDGAAEDSPQPPATDDEVAARMAITQKMVELRKKGMTDEQILEEIATEELFGTGIEIPEATPGTLPRAGELQWGTWSQTESNFYLELKVPSYITAKLVAVEVKAGVLDVRLKDE